MKDESKVHENLKKTNFFKAHNRAIEIIIFASEERTGFPQAQEDLRKLAFLLEKKNLSQEEKQEIKKLQDALSPVLQSLEALLSIPHYGFERLSFEMS